MELSPVDLKVIVVSLQTQRKLEDLLLATSLTREQRKLIGAMRARRLEVWAALNPPDALLSAAGVALPVALPVAQGKGFAGCLGLGSATVALPVARSRSGRDRKPVAAVGVSFVFPTAIMARRFMRNARSRGYVTHVDEKRATVEVELIDSQLQRLVQNYAGLRVLGELANAEGGTR